MKRFATLLGLAAVASSTTVVSAQPFQMALPAQQAPQTAAQVAPYARPPQMPVAQPYPAMTVASPALVNSPQYAVPQYASAPQMAAPTAPRATLASAPQYLGTQYSVPPQYSVAQYSPAQYAPAPYSYGAPSRNRRWPRRWVRRCTVPCRSRRCRASHKATRCTRRFPPTPASCNSRRKRR